MPLIIDNAAYGVDQYVGGRFGNGEGWVHELKHDGYRLQVHVRDGRVRLYTMNTANWTARLPRASLTSL